MQAPQGHSWRTVISRLLRREIPTLEEKAALCCAAGVTSLSPKDPSTRVRGLFFIHKEPRPILAPCRGRLHPHRRAPGVHVPAVSPRSSSSRPGDSCVGAELRSQEKEQYQSKLHGTRTSPCLQSVASAGSSPPLPHHFRTGASLRFLTAALFRSFP